MILFKWAHVKSAELSQLPHSSFLYSWYSLEQNRIRLDSCRIKCFGPWPQQCYWTQLSKIHKSTYIHFVSRCCRGDLRFLLYTPTFGLIVVMLLQMWKWTNATILWREGGWSSEERRAPNCCLKILKHIFILLVYENCLSVFLSWSLWFYCAVVFFFNGFCC